MKKIRQVFANKGVEVEYRKRLDKLIDAMNKSILYWVLSDYGNRTPKEMARAIQKRIKQWNKVFGDKASDMAIWFVKSLKKHTEFGMKLAFNESGLNPRIAVPLRVQKAVEIENTDLIKSIPEKYFSGIQTVAMLALLYDWDKTDLTNAIEKRYNITKRRAKTIASDQSHKANELFKIAICKDLGVKEAKWVYTWRSKEPRMHHIGADGKRFDLNKGCLIDGEYIYPSQPYNCKCSFVPIIAELGDEIKPIEEPKR